mmetsp:Transcript_137501/g.383488  ORF Transcript_137501/g.383488 Transcript_137501/m.383488 type:complete len:214 (+) Transcript_137501:1699-2340(+)
MHEVRHLHPGVTGRHGTLSELLDRRYVRAIVVQKGANMESLGEVHLLLAEYLHDIARLADVAEDDQMRTAVLAQIHCCLHARVLIEVYTDQRQRMLGQGLPTGHVVLHMIVHVHEQAAVAATRVYDELRLGRKVLAAEHEVDVAHQVFEERLVLCTTADDIQSPVDVLLRFHGVLAGVDEAPPGIFIEDVRKVGEHGSVRHGHIERVTTLQSQ